MQYMSLTNIFNRRNRILLRELVITDFKLRYQGSALGYLWSLLKPLFIFAILYIVFGHFLKFGTNIENFPLYLLLGVVLWNFFTEATSQGQQAIVARGDLIRKINFPKYIIVISGTVSALINLGFNLLVVFAFMIFSGIHVGMDALLFPLILLELYMLSLAIAFFLAAAYVKYRDIGHLWEVSLQAAFYATPVLYAISMVADVNMFAAKILMLNPMAQLIQDAREILITPQTTTLYELISNPWLKFLPIAIVILLLVGASYYFKKSSKYFAENV